MVNNEDEGGQAEVYGHVMRRHQEYVGTKMMEVTKKKKRRKRKRRFLDVVKENMGKLVQRRRTLKTGGFGER